MQPTHTDRTNFLLNHGTAVIYACKPDGDFGATFVSENISEILGYKPSEFLEYSGFWADRIHAEDQSKIFAELSNLFRTGSHLHSYRFLHKNGEYVWIKDELKLIKDADGQNLEIIGHMAIINQHQLTNLESLAFAHDKAHIEYLYQQIAGASQELNKLHTYAVEIEKILLSALINLCKARDDETGNHLLRVQNYVRIIATRLAEVGQLENPEPDLIENLFRAAPLHDIGKIGIPDAILKKPGAFNDSEWAIMKTHTTLAEEVLLKALNDVSINPSFLRIAIEIATGHHENWDGSGYPKGLAGKTIPQSARIMAVADAYDALVSKRVYKKHWTHEMAIAEICQKTTIKFDPQVVQAFLDEQDKIQELANIYRD